MIFKTIETAKATLLVTNSIDESKLKSQELEWLKKLETKYRKNYGHFYEEDNLLTFNRYETMKMRDIIERLEKEEDNAIEYGIETVTMDMTNYNVEDYKSVILEEE